MTFLTACFLAQSQHFSLGHWSALARRGNSPVTFGFYRIPCRLVLTRRAFMYDSTYLFWRGRSKVPRTRYTFVLFCQWWMEEEFFFLLSHHIFFLFFLQYTTWSHTLCTDAKETEELSGFIIGKNELAVNTARVQKPSFVFATSEVFWKVLFLV